jgi:hypothetical protein
MSRKRFKALPQQLLEIGQSLPNQSKRLGRCVLSFQFNRITSTPTSPGGRGRMSMSEHGRKDAIWKSNNSHWPQTGTIVKRQSDPKRQRTESWQDDYRPQYDDALWLQPQQSLPDYHHMEQFKSGLDNGMLSKHAAITQYGNSSVMEMMAWATLSLIILTRGGTFIGRYHSHQTTKNSLTLHSSFRVSAETSIPIFQPIEKLSLSGEFALNVHPYENSADASFEDIIDQLNLFNLPLIDFGLNKNDHLLGYKSRPWSDYRRLPEEDLLLEDYPRANKGKKRAPHKNKPDTPEQQVARELGKKEAEEQAMGDEETREAAAGPYSGDCSWSLNEALKVSPF